MKEAKIGTLSWFAGVWWFLLAVTFQGIAQGLFSVNLKWLNPPTWFFLKWSGRFSAMAFRCAVEGGAEE